MNFFITFNFTLYIFCIIYIISSHNCNLFITQQELCMNIFKKLFRNKKKNWYEEAVQQAISEGILVDYLTRKGDKVAEMLKDEYESKPCEDIKSTDEIN